MKLSMTGQENGTF